MELEKILKTTYEIAMPEGMLERDGVSTKSRLFGAHRDADNDIVITHIPTGFRVGHIADEYRHEVMQLCRVLNTTLQNECYFETNVKVVKKTKKLKPVVDAIRALLKVWKDTEIAPIGAPFWADIRDATKLLLKAGIDDAVADILANTNKFKHRKDKRK